MKTTVIEYVVYDDEGFEVYVLNEKYKRLAMEKAQLLGGYVRKRVSVIEELAPLDEECTVWG